MPEFQTGVVKCALNIALKYFRISMSNANRSSENYNRAAPHPFHNFFNNVAMLMQCNFEVVISGIVCVTITVC